MTHKLNMKLMERYLTMTELLPKEGSFVALKQIRKAKENLSPGEATRKRCKIRQPDEKGSIKFDIKEANRPEVVELPDFAFDIIKAKLRKMDDDKKLEEKHYSLYELFVEGQNANDTWSNSDNTGQGTA